MTNTDTTTESTEETSTDSVSSQVETTTNDSSVTSEETTETTTEAKQPSIEELQAQINRISKSLAKANNEAKTFRLENNELKQYKAQVEAEKLTEQEKRELAQKQLEAKLAELQKSHDDAVREKQELRIDHAVAIQAQKLGFADPDDAKRFLDLAELEFDENGIPTNVADLLGNVLKNKPYLKAQSNRPVSTSGGATNPSRSTTTAPQELSWEVIGKLTPAQYEARRNEIQAWMNNPKNQSRRR
jgi:hypothetical protein